MNKNLITHLTDLQKLNTQRKAWLVLSALVMCVIGFIIFDNHELSKLNILWVVGAVGITLSVVWWYWAMRLINKMFMHRKEEIEILGALFESVVELRDHIRKNGLD